MYGLGTLAATLLQMGEITTKFAYRALPGLGVNRNMKSEWNLHTTFGGVGLLSLSTEATICRVNLFLQHWEMPSPIGNLLRASMELLHLEVGCTGCPLGEAYHPIGPIITHSWLRSFWEVVAEYNLQVLVNYPELELPWSNDRTIMSIALLFGYEGDALLSINRCRMFLCAIFFSDLATANGWSLDKPQRNRFCDHANDSNYSFPRERPSDNDWEVWQSMWNRYCQRDGTFPIHLGRWVNSTHRNWRWFYGQD